MLQMQSQCWNFNLNSSIIRLWALTVSGPRFLLISAVEKYVRSFIPSFCSFLFSLSLFSFCFCLRFSFDRVRVPAFVAVYPSCVCTFLPFPSSFLVPCFGFLFLLLLFFLLALHYTCVHSFCVCVFPFFSHACMHERQEENFLPLNSFPSFAT